jgi:uncharacterized membrane protein
MPPVEGFTVAHFLTVADLKRSAEFYKTVFDGEIVSMGDVVANAFSIEPGSNPSIINVPGDIGIYRLLGKRGSTIVARVFAIFIAAIAIQHVVEAAKRLFI